MQMQRWFGYRGSYVELCRVFASPAQLTLFMDYHDMDEAIRNSITERMMGRATEPTILQGLDFRATGKIAGVGTYPISPGARPFVKVLNDGNEPDPNAELVAELFSSGPSSQLVAGNRVRGRILNRPLTLLEAADWLDRFRYGSYKPGTESELANHWTEIGARLSAVAPLPPAGLYRAPAPGLVGDPPRRACPYSIAAYLRLWHAALTRRVRGLFVTGEPGQLWSMSDLKEKQTLQPRFWVGVRFGNGRPVAEGPLGDLPFEILATMKNVDSTGELTTQWGASDPTAGPGQYRSDLYFDYYHRGETLPVLSGDSTWRPAGSDGQILLYVNQLAHQPHPAIAVALCIPAGGPEQFAATRASTILTRETRRS
jgi:Z1 domain.